MILMVLKIWIKETKEEMDTNNDDDMSIEVIFDQEKENDNIELKLSEVTRFDKTKIYSIWNRME